MITRQSGRPEWSKSERVRLSLGEIKIMKIVILLLPLLAGWLGASEVPPRTVEYARVDGVSLKLDLHSPDDLLTTKPLIVWVHGGAWRAGNRESLPIKKLVGMGFVIASVDCRLTTVAPYPANVHDIKAAIRFLRAHAKGFRINGKQITIEGSPCRLFGCKDPR
jgi:acetyl esterase/lipase